MKKPFIFYYLSVIVPCYNEVRHIKDLLDSLIKQTFPKEQYEVLIMDGGSTDGTLEIIAEYIKKFPNIRLIKNPNKYTSHALNIGVKESKGDIVCRCDAHCLPSQDYLFNVNKAFNDYPEADAVGGQTILP